MNATCCKAATLLLVVVMACATVAQSQLSEAQNPKWDFSIWAGGATGEEATNSFSEAQILTGGFYVGRVITGELGNRWYRDDSSTDSMSRRYLCNSSRNGLREQPSIRSFSAGIPALGAARSRLSSN